MLGKIEQLVAAEVSGDSIYHEMTALYLRDRRQSFANFRKTAEYCRDWLNAAGLDEARLFPFAADGKTAYWAFLPQAASDMHFAELEIISPAPLARKLCDSIAEPRSVAMRSRATSKAGTVASLIPLDDGKKPTGPPSRAKGKIALARTWTLCQEALRAGAIGVITDHINPLKGARNLNKLQHVTEWWYGFRPEPRRKYGPFGFVVSPAEGMNLRKEAKKLARRGKHLTLRAFVDARAHHGNSYSPLGVIHGTGSRQGKNRNCEEVMATAHLYEPGALDNGSGVATLLEAARVLAKLIRQKKLPKPKRNIRFMFGWEFYMSAAYYSYRKKQGTLHHIIAGTNVDSVGGYEEKLGCPTHLWRNQASMPSYTDSVMLEACRIVRKRERCKAIPQKGSPFSLGSDSDFAEPTVGIPMPSFVQHPTLVWHNSYDVPAVMDREALRGFAITAATYLYFVASAGDAEALHAAGLAAEDGRLRLAERASRRIRELAGKAPGLPRRRPGKPGRKAVRAVEEIEFWGGVHARAVESAAGIASNKRVVERKVGRLAESVRRASRTQAEKLRRKLKIRPAKRAKKARSAVQTEASGMIPSRIMLGSVRGLAAVRSRKLRSQGKIPAFPALSWADGKRNVEEIARLCELEKRKKYDLKTMVAAFKSLARTGFIKLSISRTGIPHTT